jgi:predicted HicB family RNase H-like nuclease
MGRRRKEPTRELRRARFGVYLKPQTHLKLLAHALRENTSATELVERLIEDYLSRRPRRADQG